MEAGEWHGRIEIFSVHPPTPQKRQREDGKSRGREISELQGLPAWTN